MGDNLDCYNRPHYYNATTRKDNHINYSEVFAICKYQPCPNRLKTRAKKAEGNRFVPTPKDPVTTGSGETFVKTRSPVDMLGQALTAGSRGVAGVLVVMRGESGLELPVG